MNGAAYNDCYACRNYFTDCDEPKHSKRIWAQHNDGRFWWGTIRPGKGRKVKICVGCRDELSKAMV